jgi:hypothetical protein
MVAAERSEAALGNPKLKIFLCLSASFVPRVAWPTRLVPRLFTPFTTAG